MTGWVLSAIAAQPVTIGSSAPVPTRSAAIARIVGALQVAFGPDESHGRILHDVQHREPALEPLHRPVLTGALG